MAEESFEASFGSCVLEVLTPDTSVSFPENVCIDDWLLSVKNPQAERKQAFFDEHLNLLLLIEIAHPSLNDHSIPPKPLVNLLSHVQVSLEATYISQTPSEDVQVNAGQAPSHTPRSLPPTLHPSIFPPHTPNPIPSTTESDRKYVQAEGTLLFSTIWGTKKVPEEPKERFSLLYSEARGCWIAIYELSLVVSYLRLPFSDPLLCLTASATLRDKALSPSHTTHPLIAHLIRTGIISHLDSGIATPGENDEEGEVNEDTGFEEINLLEGLSLGPVVSSDPQPLYLPSTRLGNSTRQQFFSLSALPLLNRTPPSAIKQAPHHVLRKSYRKILHTVSGFRVRMRTVFVPHVLLPEKPPASENHTYNNNDLVGGDEEREAGNSERTVVLCVEVENSGESGSTVGFCLERLDVKIGGEGATTRLIGWGEDAFNSDVENHLFPLRIGSMEQFNLLYVVSFWNTPHDQENPLLTGQGTIINNDLQRTVSIVVYGRPYMTGDVRDQKSILSYPTQTFSSRWNCILDLASKPPEETVDFSEALVQRNVLPEPPSPFPGRNALSSLIATPASKTPTPQAIAGKRNTLPGSITAMRAINHPASSRLSLPRELSGGLAVPPSAPVSAFTPPSVALQTFNRPPSAMFGMMPPGPSNAVGNVVSSADLPQSFVTPPRPVHSAVLPSVSTPNVHAFGKQSGNSGPSVDIKRERGAGMAAAVPQTPFPTVLNTLLDARAETLAPSGEPIIVSVGLMPAESGPGIGAGDGCACTQRKIYPSDQFTLDIFVFNQSSWTRRFEISYPSAESRQHKAEKNKAALGSRGKNSMEELKSSISPPGILPLQNRVRVGPLKPSTCQSVRMDFLAISPGVHSVDTLILTDIGTSYTVNLRSVIDIVIHERILEEKLS